MNMNSLWEAYPHITKSNNELQTSPSGRGRAVPAYAPGKYRQSYPILPIPAGMPGTTGMPSMEPSMAMSKFIQDTPMGEDDIEYYKTLQSKAPYAVEPGNTTKYGAVPSEEEDLEEQNFCNVATELFIETDDIIDEDDDEEESDLKDEVSTTASIAGYTGPLGASPSVPGKKRRKTPIWKSYADAFGGAKLASKRYTNKARPSDAAE